MNAEGEKEQAEEDNDVDEAGVVEVSSTGSGSEEGDHDAASSEGGTGDEAAEGKESSSYSNEVVRVTHQRSFYAESSTGTVAKTALQQEAEAVIVPETVVVEESKDMDLQTAAAALPTGAETASEIFRHLQATRGKDEVTTELAKILNVLESTLQEEDESDDDDDDDEADEDSEETSDSEKENEGEKHRAAEHESPEAATQGAERSTTTGSHVPSPGVTRKPPKHPNPRRTPRKEVVPYNEGGRAKSGKEEMGILSKILVTLLCSCKSAAASGELKRVIRQFREAAREATDEVGEDMKGRSSKTRAKRSLRHRDGVQKDCSLFLQFKLVNFPNSLFMM